MEKVLTISGKEVGFKATASTTKRYRQKFNRDLFKDIEKLIPKVNEEQLGVDDLECFMDIAYIMAYQYNNTIPEDPDDWLDEFEMFDIYIILPQIIELWGLNMVELETPKKKAEEQSGN